MNKNDLIYMAGFIDGEGSISVDKYSYGKSQNFAIKISITNCDYQILKWVQLHFGGYIATLKKKRDNHHTCYQLTIRHKKAYVLIKQVVPYLRLKKGLAGIVLRIAERCQQSYDHKKPKSIERQLDDETDYQLVKQMIRTVNYRNLQAGFRKIAGGEVK